MPESVAIKCDYLHQHDLLGAMYWEYAGDTDEGTLQQTVFNGVKRTFAKAPFAER